MYKIKSLIYQIMRFGIVGVICTGIDYILLYLIAKHCDYLLASAISYIISTMINYILSMKYVFVSKNESKIKEIYIFMALSFIGLLLTELFMYLFTELFMLYYMLSKIIATIAVLLFNFITRKLFLEKRN